ncbi:MAG: DUF2807 domain-containing protein [Tannerella sp.]|jgi:hypothetical protein|nr:DUF2807 domain-containing protein [Tannerella sp.]
MKTKTVIFAASCILLILAGSFSCSLIQQKTKGNGNMVTRDIPAGDYTHIRFEGLSGMNIHYTQSETEPEIKVTVDENIFSMYEFTAEKSGLTLKPRKEYEKNRFIPTRFEITVRTGTLKSLLLAGNHTFASDTPLHGDELTLKAAGHNHIRLNNGVTVDRIEAEITGNGEITLSGISGKKITSAITGAGQINLGGRTETASVKITGNGKLQAFELQTEEMRSEIAGSGSVEISVSRSLHSTIAGFGNVRYKGNPPHIDSNIAGSGKVSRSE